jgi:hypothetical protein
LLSDLKTKIGHVLHFIPTRSGPTLVGPKVFSIGGRGLESIAIIASTATVEHVGKSFPKF